MEFDSMSASGPFTRAVTQPADDATDPSVPTGAKNTGAVAFLRGGGGGGGGGAKVVYQRSQASPAKGQKRKQSVTLEVEHLGGAHALD